MKKFRYPIILILIAIDQLTKWLVRANMSVGESIDCLGKFLSLTYVQNEGVAFSMMTGKGLLLTIVPIIASLIAIWYMEKHKDSHWTMFFALELIISGGIGNIIDRFALGYVTDMINFHFWPVFNFADIAICVGCAFLVIYVLGSDKFDKKG